MQRYGNRAEAKGQAIRKEQLNALAERFLENFHVSDEGRMPQWAEDRFLYLCWKWTANEWLLAEDSETTEQMHAEDSHGNEVAKLKRE